MKTQIQQSDMTPQQVQRMVRAAWRDGRVYAWNGSPEEAVFGVLGGHDTDPVSGLIYFEVRDGREMPVGTFFNVRAESLGHPIGSHPTRKRALRSGEAGKEGPT